MCRRKLRVLIIDDDPADITLITRHLETLANLDIAIQPFNDLASAQGGFATQEADLILLDYMLGAVTGLDALQAIQAAGVNCPIIMLTGQGSEEIAVKAMHLGASDYLVKDTSSLRKLGTTIENALENHRLRQQIEESRHQLEEKVQELQLALTQVRMLESLLPFCMRCKRIRKDSEAWQQVETYLAERADVLNTDVLCDDCLRELYPEYVRQVGRATAQVTASKV